MTTNTQGPGPSGGGAQGGPPTTGSFSEYGHLSTNAVPDDVLQALTDWITKEVKAK